MSLVSSSPHRDRAPECFRSDPLPTGLLALRDRLREMPPAIRDELLPIVEEALDDASFRGRVLAVAREALVRLRLDLAMAQFDLDATRREREDLRKLLKEMT